MPKTLFTRKWDALTTLWGMWLFTIILFCVFIIYAYLAGAGVMPWLVKESLLQTATLVDIAAGVIFFGVLVFAGLYRVFLKNNIISIRRPGIPGAVGSYLLYSGILLVLPLYLFFRLINLPKLFMLVRTKRLGVVSGETVVRRIIAVAAVILLLFPAWAGAYYLAGYMAGNALGYVREPQAISGTGSMYPTFPKGEGDDDLALSRQVVGTPGMFRYPNGLVLWGKRYFGHELGRGDIVVVENERIRERTEKMYGEPGGWVKRIIALAGDTLELRAGTVYLNDVALREQYIAKPQSTFGQSFLGECKKITVPPDTVFIMGDNRKGSGDSRDMGFVEVNAVNHVIPLKSQVGVLDHGWRDTTKDFDETSKIRLDIEEYVRLLNEKRREAGVKPVSYQEKLAVSAQKRGTVMLKYDDFSFEATRSGYTMGDAMRDANYSNIVWGEAPTLGYYEAEELIENQFQFPESKKFLLDATFQEIGVSEVTGAINGCPSQVIVAHFAGYVPPNYSKEVVESWRLALTRLLEIQPGWNNLTNVFSVYDAHKTEVNRINEIIAMRISNIRGIVSRMEANQWLTPEQNKFISMDEQLAKEQDSLATKLNSY